MAKADPKSVHRENDDCVEIYEEIRTEWMMVLFTERRLRGAREGSQEFQPQYIIPTEMESM